MARHLGMPDLSIAIAAKGACDSAHFWQAFGEATFHDASKVEICLAYDDPATLKGIPGYVHTYPMEGASLFQLWGEAAVHASAPYIALLHIHAPPAPGWIDVVLAAITDGFPAYQGPVEHSYSAGDHRIVGYLVEYAQFHRPVAAKLTEVPGNNLIFDRKAFRQADHPATQTLSKTKLVSQWRKEGIAPRRIDAVVVHDRPFNLARYATRRFRHGRTYAHGRSYSWNFASRILAIGFTPFLPWLRIYRILSHARRVPALRKAARRNLLRMIIAEIAWSFGEFVAYLGLGHGDEALLD